MSRESTSSSAPARPRNGRGQIVCETCGAALEPTPSGYAICPNGHGGLRRVSVDDLILLWPRPDLEMVEYGASAAVGDYAAPVYVELPNDASADDPDSPTPWIDVSDLPERIGLFLWESSKVRIGELFSPVPEPDDDDSLTLDDEQRGYARLDDVRAAFATFAGRGKRLLDGQRRLTDG